jgi:light-regulated signal transduction histidine kinase (bacteriophytochrome)
MTAIIDALLKLARVGRQPLELRRTSLHQLVSQAIEELGAEREGRAVHWQIGDLPFARCDRGLMKQVFTNLLSNALKYTRSRETSTIAIGQTVIDGALAIFVRDNGAGFDMKYADKLFEQFQRLHRQEEFEGTGIGLATVQRIVYRHGGRIWAEASVGEGATFYFTGGLEASNRPTLIPGEERSGLEN